MKRRFFIENSLSALPLIASSPFSMEGLAAPLAAGNSDPGPARPPMGWNSFDAYDSRITEDEFLRCAEVIRRELLPHGWDTVVIDYIWSFNTPGIPGDPTKRHGHPNIRFEDSGEPIDRVEMDSDGRLLPAPERFPSAANGKGFKPIADKVQAMGHKFGIHIMRGIHRQAVWDKHPVLNSSAKANDIAEPFDTCQWCNHMFGLDGSKPGATEYYDSLFRLYAEWGVDFVKVDDVLFHPYHDRELELIDAARRKCGRPMVLSASCGEAAVSRAAHIAKHCNMWRISADFWDNWKSLRHNFDLLAAWSPWILPGQWLDADMIPIGKLSLDNRPHEEERMSRFNAPEKRTLMTLWSISRSPLMWGGDPLSLDDETKELLTNSEVLAVNQHANDNRQLYLFDTEHRGQSACWVATDPSNGDRFVALFNLSDSEAPAVFDPEHEHMRGAFRVRDLWKRKEIGVIEGAHRVILPAHGAGFYRFRKITHS